MQNPIENIVTSYSKWTEGELRTLFFRIGEKLDMSQVHLSDSTKLEDLMLEIGAYPSKSESKRAGRLGPIPIGWTHMWANKKRQIYIWNPSDATYEEN